MHSHTTDEQPQLHLFDVVTSRHAFEPFEQRPGVIMDIFRVPYIPNGYKYRVEYRDGHSTWYWIDELILQTDAFDRSSVIAELTTLRAHLFRMISTTEQHDVLNTRLSALLDQLTATARTYLGSNLDHEPDHSRGESSENQGKPINQVAEGGDQA
ncbi:hypothetical protein [Actinoplanes sp. NPDC020271]|uniref:hypothetical protein n=1 Tax=Actinoplanes sp. NPDC020271 TaxID=3363896 RepID=UPI0037B89D0A